MPITANSASIPSTSSRAQAVELQAKLDAIAGERVELERRVQLLHDGTLEKDMLDEQARRALNCLAGRRDHHHAAGLSDELTEFQLIVNISAMILIA